MIFLDSSALVRFFLNDDPVKAEKVEKLLNSSEQLVLLECVVVEFQFVLLRIYKRPKEEVVQAIRYLLKLANIRCSYEVKLALSLFERRELSFPDALILVYSEGNKVASFDKALIKVAGTRF